MNRDVQPFDNAEVCEPTDSGFTVAQLKAINAVLRRNPSHYVYIGVGDHDRNFQVNSSMERMAAQTEIFRMSEEYRVWVVQYGRGSKDDPYEVRGDVKLNRRKSKFH
jgi:hypothetical protein